MKVVTDPKAHEKFDSELEYYNLMKQYFKVIDIRDDYFLAGDDSMEISYVIYRDGKKIVLPWYTSYYGSFFNSKGCLIRRTDLILFTGKYFLVDKEWKVVTEEYDSISIGNDMWEFYLVNDTNSSFYMSLDGKKISGDFIAVSKFQNWIAKVMKDGRDYFIDNKFQEVFIWAKVVKHVYNNYYCAYYDGVWFLGTFENPKIAWPFNWFLQQWYETANE